MLRRSRYAVPVVAAGVIALGAWVPRMAAAGGTPTLPGASADTVVARALDSNVTELSGTIAWRANLGLPSLSGLTDGSGQSVQTSGAFDPTSLLSGTQTFQVWVDGTSRERVAVPGTLQETDLVRDGNQAWSWNSSTAHVTHWVFPTPAAAAHPGMGRLDGLTPQAVAGDFLQTIDRTTTTVTVAANRTVAGRSAYVLQLAPDRSIAADRDSTVRSVDIAVDASTGFVLQVSVYAEGQASPALQVGYTSISYGRPPAADLAVPHGQSVTQKIVRTHPRHHEGRTAGRHDRATTVLGSHWGAILAVPVPGTLGMRAASVTTVVSGSWGTGRLMTSSLLNALILPDGRALIGFVTPAALERAAS